MNNVCNFIIVLNLYLNFLGFMTPVELQMFQSVPSKEFNTYWIPCTWFTFLLKQARKEKRIFDSMGVKVIVEVNILVLLKENSLNTFITDFLNQINFLVNYYVKVEKLIIISHFKIINLIITSHSYFY